MKIGFISLGCPKNLVDSEVMLGLTQEAGHTLTREPADADVLVVNTCAFIDSAKQESIDAILEMAAHKRNGRTRLVVAGCLAERYGEQLRREIPEIDVVLGLNEVPNIVQAIGGTATGLKTGGPTMPVKADGPPRGGDGRPRGAAPPYLYGANTPRVLTTPRHYAYVKIAEGCDYTCAFCIIPKLRGAYRSRPMDSVVDESRRLAQKGVREIILISQDTTFYGVDSGERGALARLLRRLNGVDGLEWIRLLYLYPTTVDEGVLDAMAECEKVCKYVDLPLQHASAEVLKRMKRPGTGDSYRRLLARIRERVPGVTLRTTFIVGFPGETEAEFDELQRFLREVRFDHVGVFTYSHEEGTSAYEMTDDVPAGVKAARRNALMSAQRSLVAERNRQRIGERVRVLVDGTSAEHELVLRGRTEGQAPDIDSVAYLTDCDPAAVATGSFVHAGVVDARDYDLVVRPCPPPVCRIAAARPESPQTGGGRGGSSGRLVPVNVIF
jgi:ribosomal protein S12 methylthiotransferase